MKQIAGIIFLAIFGIFYLLAVMQLSIGVGSDSVAYFGAADNLRNGRGLTLPYNSTFVGDKDVVMTHFPPLYSVILAVGAEVGDTVVTAARYLHAILFGCMILAVGLLTAFFQPRSIWSPIITSFLMLSSATIIRTYIGMMSEPVFLLLWLAGFFCLDRYLVHQRWLLLLAAAIFLSLTLLTRYSGITLTMTAVLWLLYRRQLKPAIGLGIISITPLATWLLFTAPQSNGVANRSLVWHPFEAYHFWQSVQTISSWIVPDNITPVLQAVSWLLIIGALVWLIYRRALAETDHLLLDMPEFLRMMPLMTLIYLPFLVLSISFLDVQIPMSGRILSPIFIAGILWCGYVIPAWWRQASWPLQRAALFPGTIFCLAYLVSMAATYQDFTSKGDFYNTPRWYTSETVMYLRTLPPDVTLVSNAPDVIYYFTGRSSATLPAQYHDTSVQPNENYAAEVKTLGQEMAAGTQIVYFYDMPWRWFLPEEADLTAALPLQPVALLSDGAIYTWGGH
ncbi:MAG: phospholipid carrier-dependent glycosyltransferase [Chloroflexi bacterium]|nr:phospholipid carrier-dependent glycosyltransferase [Chloroflexota bacterium]